jgi:maltose O-acetyltransferase
MNIIKRIFRNTKPYKFLSWLYEKYYEDQKKVYSPAQFKEFGKDVTIYKNVCINMPERVVLKDGVTIYQGALINSQGGLYIGENTGIGYNCTIFTGQHRYRDAESIPFDKNVDLKPVIIREFVWTGAGVMIMPGIEIGEGAIIGMGAVVTKNVPPLAIVLGNPAEIIGYRSKKHYYKCKKEGKSQAIRMGSDIEHMVYMFKIRYEKELKELGLL